MMPYDDPLLSELSGYFTAKEPGRRARADAWATAVGRWFDRPCIPPEIAFVINEKQVVN